jgi:hypothetical protein
MPVMMACITVFVIELPGLVIELSGPVIELSGRLAI